MKTIGITGGVGSGKTAVIEHFEKKYGARIIIADQVAHLLEEPGMPCYNKLVEAFGEKILDASQQIDKKKFASLIFQSENALETVNSIIHPEVKKYILDEIEKERINKRDYVIVEAALLIEDGYLDILDEIWFVYTEESIRRQRLKESRGYSDEKIDSIIASQLDEETYKQKCHHIIVNNATIEKATKQIDLLLS